MTAEQMLEKVRSALGRTHTIAPPPPPALPEPLIRLVHSDIGLPELFARMAAEAKFKVKAISAEDLPAAMIGFLQSHQCKRIGLPKSALLEKLGLPARLKAAGFNVRRWDEPAGEQAERSGQAEAEVSAKGVDGSRRAVGPGDDPESRGDEPGEDAESRGDEPGDDPETRGDVVPGAQAASGDDPVSRGLTLDEAYDLDCGITDVHAAVAETGSIVIRPDAGHGRLLSLAPPIHIAVIEPRNFVADLVDLFEKLGRDGIAPNTTIITGPSKTADIEGVLVTGVHGPGLVQLYILS
jgi:L-lactate utilization protein LutC